MEIDLVVIGSVVTDLDVVPHDQFGMRWDGEWNEIEIVVAVHVQQWKHSMDWYMMVVVAADMVFVTAQFVAVQVLGAQCVVDRQHEAECWSLWAAALWSTISAVFAVVAV